MIKILNIIDIYVLFHLRKNDFLIGGGGMEMFVGLGRGGSPLNCTVFFI